jgi:uncharacterized membrane protein YbjE (DUF340 family)
VAFDPFLYVAFGIGVVAGRLIDARPSWVPRATLATVVVLVGLLGASLSDVPALALVETIPVAVAFVAAILAFTVAVYAGLARWRPRVPAPPPGSARDERLPVSLVLLAALLVGLGLGRSISIPATDAIPWVLYALLAFVGFDIPLRLSAMRNAWVPILAAGAGALGAALLFVVVLRLALPVALATSLAFGFYSLAGPLVVARAGAALGLLAFLTNFLREDLTMLLSPVLGRRLGGEGIAAMGGATAMDTTLYFVTRYGHPDAGSLALATGLVLTIAATLVLPAVLALPL